MPSVLTPRTRTVAIIGLPILVALLLAAPSHWQTGGVDDVDISNAFDDLAAPALELLQRSASKVAHASKSTVELEGPHAKHHQKAVLPKQPHERLQKSKTAKPESAGAAAGVSANGVGNLPIFLTGLATDAAIITVCLLIFAFFSKKYPIIYRDNELKGFIKETVPEGFFGWASASWNVTVDQTWNAVGLDHAQLLEFTNLAFYTFRWIAIPMFFIQGPLNMFFGGNAAGQDHESYFSMGNVEFYCWLYWPISIMICYVCWCVTWMCHKGMREFMPRRFEWLRAMDRLRSNTIMMLGIPEEYQSDEACKRYWNTLLPGRVEAVNLTKDTTFAGNLKSLVHQKDDAKYHLDLSQAAWEKDGKDPDKRPTIKTTYFGSREDAIDYYSKKIQELEPEIKKEREGIYKAAKATGAPNLSNGFITFKDRKDAEVALRLDLSDNVNVWVLDYPPTPADIIWEDLTQDPRAEAGRSLLGWALVIGLLIIYMPLVVFLCNVAEMINLGPLQSIWASEAPSLGLTIMVDFLPTILNLIFKNCFSLYDQTMSQYKLSVWYWWMNVLYVVMITALGTNFMGFVTTLAQDPLRIFSLLADTMPSCTHYYMNYVAMQSYVHAMVLTRYVPLTKYRIHSRTHDEQEAKDMAEPEDQDYYGMGSRTARWSTMLCIGVVYGTLSPPVSLLSLMLFFWIRLVYGYMFNWAETKKSDLGGIFFVRALHNTWTSLHIYLILMIGVFCQRASSWGPVLVVAIAWFFVFQSQKKFYELKWERLPYPELVGDKKVTHKTQELKGTYVQPELGN